MMKYISLHKLIFSGKLIVVNDYGNAEMLSRIT